MEQRVKISALETARLACPECNRKKILQLSEYKMPKWLTRVKYTCPCGKTFVTAIEQSARQWKDIRLAGFFTIKGKDGKPLNKGQMVIKRITPEGLTMRLDKEIKIAAGTPIDVEFVLDDAMQSIVTKNVRAIAKRGQYLTALFSSKKHFDKLAPYISTNGANKPDHIKK